MKALAGGRLQLIASQAFGQLSIVLAAPVLTRVFDPSPFGAYQLALTLGVLLQPIATLRFEFIIPSEKDDSAIPHYTQLVTRTLAVLLILMGSVAGLGAILHHTSFAKIVVMTAVIAVSYAVLSIDNALLVRKKALDRLAKRNFLSGVFVAILQIAFAFAFREVIWVAVALLLGRLVAIVLTMDHGIRLPRFSLTSSEMRMDWSRTLYGIASGFVSTLSINSLVLFSQATFGTSATAYVGLAQRSASAPLGVVSKALSQSVQASIGSAVREGDIALLQRVNREIRSLLPFAIITALALIVLGPVLAVPVFGEGWETTGEIIALLGVPAGLQMLISPVTPVFYMLGAEKRLFQIQFLRLLVSVSLAGVFLVAFGGLTWSVAGFSLGTSIGYIGTYMFLKHEVTRVQQGSHEQ